MFKSSDLSHKDSRASSPGAFKPRFFGKEKGLSLVTKKNIKNKDNAGNFRHSNGLSHENRGSLFFKVVLRWIVFSSVMLSISGCLRPVIRDEAREAGARFGSQFYNGCSLFTGDGAQLKRAFDTQEALVNINEETQQRCVNAISSIKQTLSANHIRRLVEHGDSLRDYRKEWESYNSNYGASSYDPETLEKDIRRLEDNAYDAYRMQLRDDVESLARSYTTAIDACGTENPVFMAQLARTGLSIASLARGVGITVDQLDGLDFFAQMFQVVNVYFADFAKSMKSGRSQVAEVGFGELSVAYRCAIEAVASSVCETSHITTALSKKVGGEKPITLSSDVQSGLDSLKRKTEVYQKVRSSARRLFKFSFKGQNYLPPGQRFKKMAQSSSQGSIAMDESQINVFTAFMSRLIKDNVFANVMETFISAGVGSHAESEFEWVRQLWKQAARAFISGNGRNGARAFEILARPTSDGTNFFEKLFSIWSLYTRSFSWYEHEFIASIGNLGLKIGVKDAGWGPEGRIYKTSSLPFSLLEEKIFLKLQSIDNLALGNTGAAERFDSEAEAIRELIPSTITPNEQINLQRLDSILVTGVETLEALPTALLQINPNIFSQYISGLGDQAYIEEQAAQLMDKTDAFGLSISESEVFGRQMKRFCRASLALQFSDEETLNLIQDSVCGGFVFNEKSYTELMIHGGDVKGFRKGKHGEDKRLAAFRGRVCRAVAVDDILGGGVFHPMEPGVVDGRLDQPSSSSGINGIGSSAGQVGQGGSPSTAIGQSNESSAAHEFGAAGSFQNSQGLSTNGGIQRPSGGSGTSGIPTQQDLQEYLGQ